MAPTKAKKDKDPEDKTTEELAQSVLQTEPTTLVGGAELAGALLATNQVGTMMEPDAEGTPERVDK